METQGIIVIMVLITLTMGQAKKDLDIMKEMMADMSERLSLAEGKLAKTEDELATTKYDLAITNDDFVATKDELAATKDTLAYVLTYLATKDDLANTKNALMSRTEELEKEMAFLRDPPFLHACGSHNYHLSGSFQTIPYTSLLYSSTNTEGGGLDIETGVFTAPLGGSYTVYWDTQAYLNSGEYVRIYLQKNGTSIQESYQYSAYGGNDYVNDQGKLLLILPSVTLCHLISKGGAQ